MNRDYEEEDDFTDGDYDDYDEDDELTNILDDDAILDEYHNDYDQALYDDSGDESRYD